MPPSETQLLTISAKPKALIHTHLSVLRYQGPLGSRDLFTR